MIELYKPANHPLGEAIEEHLKELVVAYKLVPKSKDIEPGIPWIRSGKETYCTKEEIRQFLDELTREVHTSIMVSGDACFVDPEKGGPCL